MSAMVTNDQGSAFGLRERSSSPVPDLEVFFYLWVSILVKISVETIFYYFESGVFRLRMMKLDKNPLWSDIRSIISTKAIRKFRARGIILLLLFEKEGQFRNPNFKKIKERYKVFSDLEFNEKCCVINVRLWH